jgi:hypothetical protein
LWAVYRTSWSGMSTASFAHVARNHTGNAFFAHLKRTRGRVPTSITNKRRIVVAILAVLTGSIVLAIWAIGEPEVAIAQQTDCTLVDTFTGESFLETRPFTITSDRWQLTYEVSGLEQGIEAGLFITVYSAANDQFVTSTSQEREGINIFAVNAGPGTYCLDIVSVFGSWRVNVEECGGGGFPIAGSATTTSLPATTSPTATASPTSTAQPTPNPLLRAGGPRHGPVPFLPGGRCPFEYPVKRGDGCYTAAGS